jgi:hypothetical protein
MIVTLVGVLRWSVLIAFTRLDFRWLTAPRIDYGSFVD